MDERTLYSTALSARRQVGYGTSANRETRQFGKFVSKVSESLGFASSTMSN